jgi:hypothetical protein
MIRWALFALLVAGLTLFYLILDFKGLSHAKGMEQAQISREIARGKQFTTKCLRPLAIWQINEWLKRDDPKDPGTPLVNLRDTYHSPLNPLLNSIPMLLLKRSGKDSDHDGLSFLDSEDKIFFLDYVIAGASMILLLASIGVSYLLTSHIFDRKIGLVTALLMLLCNLLWKFAQSGLPQPLMLFLFAFATYFFYRAVENVNLGRSPYLWVVLAALFFGLLALAHWIAVWVFIGALIYAAFFLRPRGVVALVMCGVFLFIVIWWPLLVNLRVCGNPLGSGFYQFYSGLAGGSEGMVMRNFNPATDPLNPDGFLRKVTLGTVVQLTSILNYMGGILAAPLFFISLLHPFKRPEIAQFRWAILLMWVWASVGMAIFGLPDGASDANQIHILFIPLMTAYGLALLSVLWSRLSLPVELAMARNGHFILTVLVSSAPLLLTVPWDINSGLHREFKANYPPYLPIAYPLLTPAVQANEVLVSDAPWAVAWYADRTCVWLPRTRGQFETLHDSTKAAGYPLAGILLTPISTHRPYASDIVFRRGEYGEWGPLIESFSAMINYRSGYPLAAMDESFPFKFPNRIHGLGDMIFYSDRKRLE